MLTLIVSAIRKYKEAALENILYMKPERNEVILTT